MSELGEKLAKFKAQATAQLTEVGISSIDDNVLDGLVQNLRLVIDNKDALLVSGTDDSELETVYKNFVERKLNISDRDKAMEAIRNVASQMSSIRMKNRAAFYYLVQNALS